MFKRKIRDGKSGDEELKSYCLRGRNIYLSYLRLIYIRPKGNKKFRKMR